jgi:hypothetical protein
MAPKRPVLAWHREKRVFFGRIWWKTSTIQGLKFRTRMSEARRQVLDVQRSHFGWTFKRDWWKEACREGAQCLIDQKKHLKKPGQYEIQQVNSTAAGSEVRRTTWSVCLVFLDNLWEAQARSAQDSPPGPADMASPGSVRRPMRRNAWR